MDVGYYHRAFLKFILFKLSVFLVQPQNFRRVQRRYYIGHAHFGVSRAHFQLVTICLRLNFFYF